MNSKNTPPTKQPHQPAPSELSTQPESGQPVQAGQSEHAGQPERPEDHEHESLKDEVRELREKAREKVHQETTVRGKKMEKGDIFKFVGLIAFFGIMILICFLVWPYVADIFEPGGLDRIIADVRNAGVAGFAILLGLQFLQVVVAFIPGEVVQIAAGLLYGPWIGALIIVVGCIISSAFIFVLVHKLGAPFVQGIVPTKYLDKFRAFEKTGKLNIVVFILFLIPGLPKDTFTYLVPLTDMNLRTFLLLSTVGRIPGIVVSTYAADGIMDGRIAQSVIIFAIAAVIALLGIVFQKRIMQYLEKRSDRKK